jgi:hypothetical protein
MSNRKKHVATGALDRPLQEWKPSPIKHAVTAQIRQFVNDFEEELTTLDQETFSQDYLMELLVGLMDDRGIKPKSSIVELPINKQWP